MGNTASQVDVNQDKLEANGGATKRNLSVGDLNQYQKDPAFLPDKTETWVTSKDQDGWVLSHNSLRGELEEMRAALNAISTTKSETTTLEAWKLKCLQSIWKYHVDHVVVHQKAEEEMLQPFLETRVKYPTQASLGHADLDDYLKDLQTKLDTAVQEQSVAAVQILAQAFEPYATHTCAHLKAEEDVAIPVLRAYFTEDECKATGKRMGSEGGHSGSFVYYITEEKFRSEVMPRWGIPFFVWYLAFGPAMKEYEASVIVQRQALETNTPPVDPGCTIS